MCCDSLDETNTSASSSVSSKRAVAPSATTPATATATTSNSTRVKQEPTESEVLLTGMQGVHSGPSVGASATSLGASTTSLGASSTSVGRAFEEEEDLRRELEMQLQKARRLQQRLQTQQVDAKPSFDQLLVAATRRESMLSPLGSQFNFSESFRLRENVLLNPQI